MLLSLPSCIRCKAPLTRDVFNRGDYAPCPACSAQLQIEVFPALFRPPAAGSGGEQVIIDSEASCYYHPGKKAQVPCHACGRFLCGLCDCELHGQHLCPSCLETGRKKGKIQSLENQRTLWDNIALALAVFPVVLLFGIYFTFITAPMAIYISLRHWNSPLSLVRRTRVRFVFAIVLGVLQLAAWIFGVYYLISK